MRPAESQATTATQLTRIAWLSARDPQKTFQSLMHHCNVTSLKECFHQLDGTKAVGVDGVTKAAYAMHLDDNLTDLVARMKRMAYRPGPVRQVLIPKEGTPQATRPLGISNLEDKVVRLMMHHILESIYEPLFLDCSYGFRPGRGCHEAMREFDSRVFCPPPRKGIFQAHSSEASRTGSWASSRTISCILMVSGPLRNS